MGNIVLKCDKCGRFYVCGEQKDIGKMDKYKDCGGTMFDTGMKFDEYLIISKISKEKELLQAMIDLKKSDIIEFNLKMSQFRTQADQLDSIRERQLNNEVPKCPTCGSTDIQKISTTSKIAGAAMFGFFSKTAKSQFKCKNCGNKW